MARAIAFSPFWSCPSITSTTCRRRPPPRPSATAAASNAASRSCSAFALALVLGLGLQPVDRRGELLGGHRQVADAAGDRVAEPPDRPSARPPHTNSTRVPPRSRSQESTAINPTPRRATWVPPQADRSYPSTSITREVAGPSGSLRSGSAAASASRHEPDPTGRSSHTTRFASASAAAIASSASGIVEVDGRDSAPRWNPTVRAAVQLVQGRREHVLAGVLLHVVEAPRPVDAAVHRRPVERPGRPRARPRRPPSTTSTRARRRGVPVSKRLPARGRVEGGAIEDDGRSGRRRGGAENVGLELGAGRRRCSRGARS